VQWLPSSSLTLFLLLFSMPRLGGANSRFSNSRSTCSLKRLRASFSVSSSSHFSSSSSFSSSLFSSSSSFWRISEYWYSLLIPIFL
jgi:hypothetical protein